MPSRNSNKTSKNQSQFPIIQGQKDLRKSSFKFNTFYGVERKKRQITHIAYGSETGEKAQQQQRQFFIIITGDSNE
jgi:hypothetical protein